MRILQLIDSLDPGGAEKMAVGFANALAKRAEFSGLAATRKEGELKNQLDENVPYLYLDRKRTIDFKALMRLRVFCAVNEIGYVQAHSSSFFLAVMLKSVLPQIKIIWHDHYGLSDFLENRRSKVLKLVSYFFEGIVSVNDKLKNWALTGLHCPKVIFLPNFPSLSKGEIPETELKGDFGRRIVCLANLRPQKNHFFLLEVAEKLKAVHPEWTFHLVGKDFEDEYSHYLKSEIVGRNLKDSVFVYGAKNDVQHIIRQADICVLTSMSEGLPIALLEYGINAKPVVSTAVGDIPKIIENGQNGFIVHKDDVDGFYKALLSLIGSPFLRRKVGDALCRTVETNYSEAVVIDKMMDWLGRKK